jgi:hypothetical protein
LGVKTAALTDGILNWYDYTHTSTALTEHMDGRGQNTDLDNQGCTSALRKYEIRTTFCLKNMG